MSMPRDPKMVILHLKNVNEEIEKLTEKMNRLKEMKISDEKYLEKNKKWVMKITGEQFPLEEVDSRWEILDL